MILPSSVSYGITFPGIVAHELAHQLMCRLTGTNVIGGSYFQISHSSGHVTSERASNIWKKTFAIAFVPFLFNNTLALLLGLSAARTYNPHGHDGAGVIPTILCYLAFSVAFHAFPSLQDAKVVDDRLWEKETPILAKIICAPFVFLFAVKAVLGSLALDLVWAFALGVLLPFIWLRGS